MPFSDIAIVLRWWGTLVLFGVAAFPLTVRLFKGWHDQGYFFSKAVGMAVIGWIIYALGTLKILPFTQISILITLALVFFITLKRDIYSLFLKNKTIYIKEELFFLIALLFWTWVKAHEPSIRGLEKFMDYGFMQSILNSRYFPPPDMWYAGESINYYYFGHLVTAVLTKLSGLSLAYTFNLMLATIFAFCLTMSFSIGRVVTGKLWGGFFTAFLVSLAGNLQTLYAFTRGYTGDNVEAFWKLGWTLEGLKTYWYANATRFIPFTIHEFPSYSFVVSDVHGHVLSIPFVLLAIALLLQKKISYIFYGFLVGVLLMTNALDGPIYFGLLMAVLGILHWKNIAFVLGATIVTSLPFISHFKSFVSGIAVNCPLPILAETKIGPLLFEGVEKCQHSPLWMWLMLWGFFLYCGYWLFYVKRDGKDQHNNPFERVLKVFFFFALVLIIVPEFFYFKDIYPAHFRSNTMFKLGYQAFILFSIVSAYVITRIREKLFLALLLPQLFLVSIYPIFSVRSYFNSLRNYEGIYGLKWLEIEYSDDYKAISWLRTQNSERNDQIILVEADGDSYTDYNHFSAFTGNPTIVGWAVHEWLWRGGYEQVSPRREEIAVIYESIDLEKTQEILEKYKVEYIVVGRLERDKFKNLREEKFDLLGRVVFRQGDTTIYAIDR